MFLRQILSGAICISTVMISLVSCAVSESSKMKLKDELTSILASDQELREAVENQKISTDKKQQILAKYNLKPEDFLSIKVWETVKKLDSVNLIEIERIIKKHGYPGKSLVGEPLNEAAFYVIQHADTKAMEKYFPILERAGEKGEISNRKVAMMQDRILMDHEKEQIYGTQIGGRLFIDSETKKEEWKYFLWPVKDYNKINALRQKMGFTNTVEEYVKQFGIDTQHQYTIEEIKLKSKRSN